MIFFKSTTYLYLHNLISTQERHFMQMWKLRIPFLYFQSIISVLVRSTYFLNMLNFHVILVVSSQHVRIWSMQQLHYIFAIFALDRDVDAPFQYQKSEREKMHLHLHTDLNLILQFIDYMHTSYFLFFQKHGQISGLPWLFFFELILIYSKYSYYYYIPIPKINRLYLEFKALTHSSNCK